MLAPAWPDAIQSPSLVLEGLAQWAQSLSSADASPD
jgi:hypothetical protein